MQPYQANNLPLEYKIDKELLNLISQANQKYSEYKTLIDTLEFDSHFFLDSILLTESYKSTQIEGTQISQDEVYYLKYMENTDDKKEIQNLKTTVDYAFKNISKGQKIDINLVNEMHRILLKSVRGYEKGPGQIRNTQNWIGPRGAGIVYAVFVPPKPEDVLPLLMNLYEYMNDEFIDPILVNIAISHAQFETIHAYRDGNGRLGRALIPIQMAMFEESRPLLFMSEVLELYKPSYQKNLMDYRKGNVIGYLKFFFQCIIDQCNSFISKLKRVKDIYIEDMKVAQKINSGYTYEIMQILMTQIVFTKKEVEELSKASKATVSRIIDSLVQLDIIVPDSTVNKKGYRYQRIYDVFVSGIRYF